MRRSIVFALTLACAGAMVLFPASPAQAHEHRHVGKWSFLVGWGDEPAYAGFKNSVELILADSSDKPVTDLGDTLKVEVSTGSQKMTLSMEPNFELGEFGTPGDYRAWLIPTQPGTYSFHFAGTIKGDKIDVTFTSSETTFDNLHDPADVQFPVKEPAPAAIAERIDREVPRLQEADTKLTTSVASATSKANTASTFGYVGMGLGAIALVLSVAGLARKKSG